MLHLSAGIELVFKSRLDIEHWTYIFDDMNHASRNKYTDGSLKTVDSNTAIERLENLCGYVFAEKQKVQLKRLRETRNRFEHGAIDNNMELLLADNGVGIEKEDLKHIFEKTAERGRTAN